jgi:hypothetical protein
VVVADSIWMAGVATLGSHLGSSPSTEPDNGEATRRRALLPAVRPSSRSVKLGFMELDILSSLPGIEIGPISKRGANP